MEGTSTSSQWLFIQLWVKSFPTCHHRAWALLSSRERKVGGATCSQRRANLIYFFFPFSRSSPTFLTNSDWLAEPVERKEGGKAFMCLAACCPDGSLPAFVYPPSYPVPSGLGRNGRKRTRKGAGKEKGALQCELRSPPLLYR